VEPPPCQDPLRPGSCSTIFCPPGMICDSTCTCDNPPPCTPDAQGNQCKGCPASAPNTVCTGQDPAACQCLPPSCTSAQNPRQCDPTRCPAGLVCDPTCRCVQPPSCRNPLNPNQCLAILCPPEMVCDQNCNCINPPRCLPDEQRNQCRVCPAGLVCGANCQCVTPACTRDPAQNNACVGNCPNNAVCDPLACACRICLNNLECDDANNCTTDTCNPNGTCSHAPKQCPALPIGDQCVQYVCNPADGQCIPPPAERFERPIDLAERPIPRAERG